MGIEWFHEAAFKTVYRLVQYFSIVHPLAQDNLKYLGISHIDRDGFAWDVWL